MDGSVTVAVSPMGIQFARVEADPQEIAGRSYEQIQGLWLSILLDGEGMMQATGLAVIEFLVATLATDGGTRTRGGADGARAALLHRILQRMETTLGNPDLSIVTLARDVGISPRYLRRLFAADQMSFAATLKARRLERCRADLTSPLHAQLGISEIAFRWGFNDAAHFSRSFRERYGPRRVNIVAPHADGRLSSIRFVTAHPKAVHGADIFLIIETGAGVERAPVIPH
jgi:AraC-like DNA-binding protein